MTKSPPPPILDSARVVAYAFVDDVPYRRRGALIVDGEPLEHVPRLAVCINLGKEIGPMLFHCDDDWNVLGVSGANSRDDSGSGNVDNCKELAERNYPGVASRWVDVNTSADAALQYYDKQTNGLKCSFCNRRPFEIERGWVKGNNAMICRNCVELHFRGFQESDAESKSG